MLVVNFVLKRSAQVSLPRTILISPLFFGLAHLHHLKRHIVDERMPVMLACAQTAIQFSYTTLFGMYTTFVFVRTAQIAAAVACHTFCNYMGLPDLSFAWPPSSRCLDWLSARDRVAAATLHRRRHWLFLAYVVGIGLFAAALFPMTDPRLFGRRASPFWDDY